MSEDGKLDSCGCCGKQDADAVRGNRPGLPAIAYRAGTHSSIFERLVSRLSTYALPDGPRQGARPFAALTTRQTDDPVVALLDAWAVAGDVVTFYEERIANEGFTRTATERASMLELARTIGYELKPGVAASTLLAFTIDSSPSSPNPVDVPAGTKVLSMPGQNQLPQAFETIEERQMRPEWNAMTPRKAREQRLTGHSYALIASTSTNVQPGDCLVFTSPAAEADSKTEAWTYAFVTAVKVVPEEGYTVLSWPGRLNVQGADRVYVLRQRASLFGHNAPQWKGLAPVTKHAFNANANPNTGDGAGDEWPDGLALSKSEVNLDLDSEYSKLTAGGWVLVQTGSTSALRRVSAAGTVTRSDYMLSAKVTRITMNGAVGVSLPLRGTRVFTQSELLPLAPAPIGRAIRGQGLELEARVPRMEKNRPAILSGKRVRAAIKGPHITLTSLDGLTQVQVPSGEGLTLLEAPQLVSPGKRPQYRYRLVTDRGFEGTVVAKAGEIAYAAPRDTDPLVHEFVAVASMGNTPEGRTLVQFGERLSGVYDVRSVSIMANVARATHGERQAEALGSGDGSVPNQRFVLRKSPLTYISAATVSGSASTLDVRVNGVLWKEAPSLYGLPPASESYITRLQRDGTTAVIFGDGVQGARLPSGVENVTAAYRMGSGLAGEVGAGKLSLLAVRPLGVKSVTNPKDAAGAAEPERLEDARRNAPASVLVLDRIVSLSDYESFAGAFSGIGKARVDLVWVHHRPVVHITAGTASGKPLDAASDTADNLAKAIATLRAPGPPVRIAGFRQAYFKLDARVRIDSRYESAAVIAAMQSALASQFCFANRGFAQRVTAAEIVTLLQGVAGVVGVDLNKLYLVTDASGPGQTVPAAVLESSSAAASGDATVAAELLLLAPRGAVIKEAQF